ncbi:MAG: 50S ribosomal protein L6 [Verrucomicrobia bacterium]|nr:MAG: 50S ribosomal protein L6 [Verrucomicrobiota bacterium]
MSRIGKLPVPVPEKVKVSIEKTTISVEGPKGKLSRTFPPVVKIESDDEGIKVSPVDTSRFARAMHGTARSIINGMVIGVTEGFSRELEIHGVGFRAALKGQVLDLALGYSHPIAYPIPEGIKVTVTDQTKVKVEGCDKQLVGKVAAEIRAFYPPEPYKGKGVRYTDERVRRKEGKTVA